MSSLEVLSDRGLVSKFLSGESCVVEKYLFGGNVAGSESKGQSSKQMTVKVYSCYIQMFLVDGEAMQRFTR